MIDVVGAPFDLCGMRPGSRLGPAAIRLAGLEEALVTLGCEVRDRGDVAVSCAASPGAGLRNFEPLLSTVVALQEEVDRSIADGALPLVIGGEHTLVVGGISAALKRYGEALGLLWIDAHADVNTPGSSPSGNIHGMPLAALAGLPSGIGGASDADWGRLLDALGTGARLRLENVAWFGLRDVDAGERANLRGLPISMHEIDRYGIEATLGRCDAWFRERGVSHLWVSFDVDALDPILAPGTGTAVRGGLTYREAHLLAEMLNETMSAPDCPYSLAGLDIVETNPLHDTMNATAIMGVEWIASLFGKTILGKRRKGPDRMV